MTIYCSGAGESKPGKSGWAFIASQDDKITGQTQIHFAGCTHSTKRTMEGMAVLQALYFSNKAKIICDNPADVMLSMFKPKLMELKNGAEIVKPNGEKLMNACREYANKGIWLMGQPDCGYNDIEAGDTVILKKSLWSIRYFVMSKLTDLIILKNLSTINKLPEVIPVKEFTGFVKI